MPFKVSPIPLYTDDVVCTVVCHWIMYICSCRMSSMLLGSIDCMKLSMSLSVDWSDLPRVLETVSRSKVDPEAEVAPTPIVVILCSPFAHLFQILLADPASHGPLLRVVKAPDRAHHLMRRVERL